jgi:perosamine synthetase
MHLCRERKLFLIEDCALAFFSREGDDFAGKIGDVAVYSFRKAVPVTDRGDPSPLRARLLVSASEKA